MRPRVLLSVLCSVFSVLLSGCLLMSGEQSTTDAQATGGNFSTSFVSAEGEVRIAEKEKVPLTLEGVSLGDAWGTLMLHAKRPDERTIKLDVDVPVFHTELPESSARDGAARFA